MDAHAWRYIFTASLVLATACSLDTSTLGGRSASEEAAVANASDGRAPDPEDVDAAAAEGKLDSGAREDTGQGGDARTPGANGAPPGAGQVTDGGDGTDGASDDRENDAGQDAEPAGDAEVAQDAGGTPADAASDADADADAGADAGSEGGPQSEPVACTPHRPPERGAACASEGEVCAHWYTDPRRDEDRYFACICTAASSTRFVWDCYRDAVGACPDEQPTSGASCFGYRDRDCPYPPTTTCSCPLDDSDLTWRCESPRPLTPAPEELPLDTPVSHLGEPEREAFCSWYLEMSNGRGFPDPPNPEPTPSGHFPTTACSGCPTPAYRAYRPFPLSQEACVANLSISTCELPLSELVDCSHTLMNACFPSPRGCGRYLEAPGCDGTLIVSLPPFEGGHLDCRIKVR